MPEEEAARETPEEESQPETQTPARSEPNESANESASAGPPPSADTGGSSGGKGSSNERTFSPQRLQNIANILTAAVALAAIALSIWQGYEMRVHNRLSVMPHLEQAELYLHEDSVYTVRFSVESTGLGPAVLQNFLVYRDSTKVYDAREAGNFFSFGKVRNELEQLPFQTNNFTDVFRPGQMLQSGEEHRLINVDIPESSVNQDSLERYARGTVSRVLADLGRTVSQDSLEQMAARATPRTIVRHEVLERRGFVFCYCSVYEENCGQTHLGAAPPEADVCDF